MLVNIVRAEADFILRSADGARRPLSKSFTSAAKTVSRLVLNFSTILRLVRCLTGEAYLVLWKKNAGIFLKPLRRGYARDLTTRNRSAIVAHHYNQVSKHLGDGFLKSSTGGEVVLWSAFDHADAPRIVATTVDQFDFEDELKLTFMLGANALYIMGAVVSPGRIWGISHESVLVVTRVQGIRLMVDQMKVATELCGDCAPRLLLFSAMEGLAAAMGIRWIVGIGVTRQIATAFETISTPSFYDNYDGFWKSLNRVNSVAGFYLLPTPLIHRPLVEIQPKHRTRAQSRRVYRRYVSSYVASRFNA